MSVPLHMKCTAKNIVSAKMRTYVIFNDLIQVHCCVTMINWQGIEITAEEGPRTETFCTPFEVNAVL